jgi:hypothetical protein
MTEMRGISTREERKLYVDQSILNERQDSQQVKVDNTVQGMAMSAMATRRGTEETSSEASMRIMKKSVLHALFTVSKPPLPAPFPAPILIAIPAQTIQLPVATCLSFVFQMLYNSSSRYGFL